MARPSSVVQRLSEHRLTEGVWLVEHTQWQPVDSFVSTAYGFEQGEVTRELWDAEPAKVLSWADYMPEWHHRAKCRDIEDWDQTYFGDNEESRASMSPARFRKAQATCAQCPVIELCALHALTKPEAYGIWAGTQPAMRDKARDLIASGIITLEEAIEVICEGAVRTFKELADAIDTGLKDVI